jgi:hypothetical protein
VQVRTADLRALVENLLTHLEQTGHQTVDLNDDFYWDVLAKERYDRYESPETLTVGQLTDDWSELTKILEQKSAPLNYALVWLAAILRRIGETAGEVTADGDGHTG